MDPFTPYLPSPPLSVDEYKLMNTIPIEDSPEEPQIDRVLLPTPFIAPPKNKEDCPFQLLVNFPTVFPFIFENHLGSLKNVQRKKGGK